MKYIALFYLSLFCCTVTWSNDLKNVINNRGTVIINGGGNDFKTIKIRDNSKLEFDCQNKRFKFEIGDNCSLALHNVKNPEDIEIDAGQNCHLTVVASKPNTWSAKTVLFIVVANIAMLRHFFW